MNRQSIHQQIDSLLKIIHDQHEQLRQHTGSIPQVEIDFMTQNLRQLYEASLLLNHTNALSSLDEIKQAVTQKILAEKRAVELKKNETKTEPVKEEILAEIPVKEKEEEQPVKAEPPPVGHHTMNEVIAKAGTAPAEKEELKDKSNRKKTAHDLNTFFEDKPTLGDKFGAEESLHLKIAAKNTSKTLGQKLHKKPIRDLKTAIGINEKFQFVSKLFGGNLQTYSEAIEKINTAPDLSAAHTLTTGLAMQFGWDTDDEHVKGFMELVERRFSLSSDNS